MHKKIFQAATPKTIRGLMRFMIMLDDYQEFPPSRIRMPTKGWTKIPK